MFTGFYLLLILIKATNGLDLEIISKIANIYKIETIFYLNHENIPFPNFQHSIPRILLNTNFPTIRKYEFLHLNVATRKILSIRHDFELSEHYKQNILAVLEVREYFLNLVNSLSQFLNNIVSTKILVFFEESNENVTSFLKTCWENNLLNVLVVTKDLKYISFSPFPDFHLTSLESSNFYPDKMADLKGYKLVTYFNNFNLFCKIFDFENSKLKYAGLQYELLKSFADKVNGEIFEYDGRFGRDLLKSYYFIDFTPCSYIHRYGDFTNFVEFYTDNIIFPLSKEIHKNEILFLPFDYQIWIISFIVFFIIGAVRRLVFSKDLVHEILNSLKFALCQGISIHSKKHKNLQVLTLLYGFVISNIYLNIFGNINKFSNVKLNSVKSLIKSGIEVLGCPSDCSEKLIYLPKEIKVNLNKTVENYTTDFAYYFPAGSYENFKEIQYFKNIRLFGDLVQLPKQYQFQHFRIKRNLPFKDALNEHILQVYSAGLPMKWKSYAVGMYWKLDFQLSKFQVFDLDFGVSFEKLKFSDIFTHFMALALGWTAALIAFLIEISWTWIINKIMFWFLNCKTIIKK